MRISGKKCTYSVNDTDCVILTVMALNERLSFDREDLDKLREPFFILKGLMDGGYASSVLP